MKKVLAIARQKKQDMLASKASVNYDNVLSGWYDYFRDAYDAGQNWRDQFAGVMASAAEAQDKAWSEQFGFTFSVRNYAAEEWFEKYQLKFAQEVNQTTIDGLAVMLKQAQEEGWSIDAITSRTQDMFGQWMTGEGTSQDFEWYADRMPPHRAMMIARTETIRSSNAGSFALFDRWGARMKSWSAVMDKATRTSHVIANDNYAEGGSPGPIPMNEPFRVGGGSLMYPGDPAGPPEETVNCRCVLIPVITEADIVRIGGEEIPEAEGQGLVRPPVRSVREVFEANDTEALRKLLAGEAHFTTFDGRDPLTNELMQELGYKGKPQDVISTADFERYVTENGLKEMWRGVTESASGISPERIMSELRTGQYYLGSGIYGSGTYTAYAKGDGALTATDYAGSTGRVQRMTLAPDARVISHSKLMHEIQTYSMEAGRASRAEMMELYTQSAELHKAGQVSEAMDLIEQAQQLNTRGELVNQLSSDEAFAAALMGYDAIDVPNLEYMVVLNRKKLILEGVDYSSAEAIEIGKRRANE